MQLALNFTLILSITMVLMSACGQSEFTGKSAVSTFSKPKGDDLTKARQPAATADAVAPQTNTNSDILPRIEGEQEPDGNLLTTAETSSGHLQLFSALEQTEFIASSAHGALSPFVSENTDANHFVSILGVFSALEKDETL